MNAQTSKVLNYLGTTGIDETPDDIYSSDEYRAFGYIRKPIADEPMIRFITAQGIQSAFPYSHLYQLDYDPSIGITAYFTEHTIELKGRALREGYERLTSHRVIFVAEADRPTAALLTDGSPVVTVLRIGKRQICSGP